MPSYINLGAIHKSIGRDGPIQRRVSGDAHRYWMSLRLTHGYKGRGWTCVFVPQVRISSISRIGEDRSIRQLQATGLPCFTLFLSFTNVSVPRSLSCPLWRLPRSTRSRVTNDSVPPVFYFCPLLFSWLERARDLLSWQPRGFSCIRT